MADLNSVTEFGIRYDVIDSDAKARELAQTPGGLLIIQPAIVNPGADAYVINPRIDLIRAETVDAVLGYMPVGRAEASRDAYQDLGAEDTFTYLGQTFLRFWEPDARGAYADNILALSGLGLDGLFLDDVSAYFFAGDLGLLGGNSPAESVALAAAAMMRTVVEIDQLADVRFGRDLSITINGGLELIHQFLNGRSREDLPQADAALLSAFLASVDGLAFESQLGFPGASEVSVERAIRDFRTLAPADDPTAFFGINFAGNAPEGLTQESFRELAAQQGIAPLWISGSSDTGFTQAQPPFAANAFTSGPDAVYGGPDADLLSPGGGADRLYGGPGDDHLVGGAGNDSLYAGDGADQVDGGTGFDVAFLFGQQDDYVVQSVRFGRSGVPEVELLGRNGEVDTLIRVEAVQFADNYLRINELLGPSEPAARGRYGQNLVSESELLVSPEPQAFSVFADLTTHASDWILS